MCAFYFCLIQPVTNCYVLVWYINKISFKVSILTSRPRFNPVFNPASGNFHNFILEKLDCWLLSKSTPYNFCSPNKNYSWPISLWIFRKNLHLAQNLTLLSIFHGWNYIKKRIIFPRNIRLKIKLINDNTFDSGWAVLETLYF